MSMQSNSASNSNDSSAERVDHPKHYGSAHSPFEAIEGVRVWNLNFALSNAIKYVLSAPSNSDLEDLKKAREYLDNEIKHREQQGGAQQ